MKLFIRLFFTFIILITVRAEVGAQVNTQSVSDVLLKQMKNHFNAGFIDSASVVSDACLTDPSLIDNSEYWFYRGLINKEMFKRYEKTVPKSLYRERSAKAFQNSLALEEDTDLVNEIKKQLKYIAATYYNDAVRLLQTENIDNIKTSIYAFDYYIEIMELADESFTSTQNIIGFTNKLGEIYGRMYENEKNTNQYYELAKNCYLKVLSLDPADKIAKYNLVVLEIKFETKQKLLLQVESDKKSREILSLNEVKELADIKLRESQLKEEAKKQELIILKNEIEINEMMMEAELERKDAIVQKEKQRQNIVLSSVIGGLVFVLVLAGFIYRSNQLKQKANEIISQQKEEVEKSYQNTKLLSEIGQKITACLTVDDITEKVYENVNQLMDASGFGIGISNEKQNQLIFPVFIEKGEKLMFPFIELSDESRPAVLCFKGQMEIFINDYEKDYKRYFPGERHLRPIAGEAPESIIYLPVTVSNKQIGVVTVQSFRKNAYTEYHLNILRNLAIYVSIALDNSQAYNKLNLALKDVEKLSIVARETKNSVMICNAEMELEWVNDTFVEINGFSLEEYKKERGKTLMEFSNSPEIKKLIAASLRKKTGVVYNSKNATKHLGDRWFQTSLSPVLDANNNLQNFVVIDSDITNLKQIEEELRQKNKDITDSIQYAKRIQQSILPSDKKMDEIFPESFILYKPKDIVSGDFYWMEVILLDNLKVSNNESEKDALPYSQVFIAAADCTGHGVPGAMVSVICNNGLNRSVREYGITDPGKILDKTREIVIQEFEKSEEEVKDGMDISLCALSSSRNEQGEVTLQWAGANNPLWIIRKNEFTEYKPDKQPIGKYAENKAFTTHTIQLQKNDSIYIFTDGFADQFGGGQGKKFKAANLKKLLLSIQDKTMKEQCQILNSKFEEWKGSLEQVDDVCIIGVSV